MILADASLSSVVLTRPIIDLGKIGVLDGFWRQGYATETAKALLRFGFDQLNLHRIFALCDPENLASAHVLEKVDMQLEGHFRERKFRKGKWNDELSYAIIDYK